MPGCTRSTQTFWKEGKFTVVAAAGINQHKERVAEMLAKEVSKVKLDKWGCASFPAGKLSIVHILYQKKERSSRTGGS